MTTAKNRNSRINYSILLTANLLFCFYEILGQNCFVDTTKLREINIFYRDLDSNYKDIGLEAIGAITFNDNIVLATHAWNNSRSSILMLNTDFATKWEYVIKDKRIQFIARMSDSTIVASGERIDMKGYWICLLNFKGQLIYFREYKEKDCNVSNMKLDKYGNIYMLIESDNEPFLRTDKWYASLNHVLGTIGQRRIFLYCYNYKGNKKWKKVLDKDKNTSKFGKELIVAEEIYVNSSYRGFFNYKKESGIRAFKFHKNGHKVDYFTHNENLKQLYFDTVLYSCTSFHNDTLILYQGEIKEKKCFSTIVYQKDVKEFWVEKAVKNRNSIYIIGSWDNNLGYLLTKIDHSGKLIGYWKDNMENGSTSIVDAVMYKSDKIIIIGNQYRKNSGEQFGKHNINLVVLSECK